MSLALRMPLFATIKVEIFVREFLPKLHFIGNFCKLVYEVPSTKEKMDPFFKFEGPPLPHPHCLYLGQFYPIQSQLAKAFFNAVYNGFTVNSNQLQSLHFFYNYTLSWQTLYHEFGIYVIYLEHALLFHYLETLRSGLKRSFAPVRGSLTSLPILLCSKTCKIISINFYEIKNIFTYTETKWRPFNFHSMKIYIDSMFSFLLRRKCYLNTFFVK